MALSPWALTSIATAKAHLNIGTNDSSQNARLELLINSASQRLESMTNRKLLERTHTEYRSGKKSNSIILKEWPVSSITELCQDSESVFAPSTVMDPASYAIDNDKNSILLLKTVFFSGIRNIKVTYVAGYNSTDHAGNLSELELACLWMVEWFYRHRERQDMGRTQKSKGDESVGILAEMPTMIKEIVMDYKRFELPTSDRMIEQL
jgi:uncharacterized phiE125 gp8 family phage protein